MEKDVEKIYLRTIKGKKRNTQPLCIFVGGVPGAGKTNLVEKIKNDYPQRDFIVIDKDEFRMLDPNYNEFIKGKKDIIEATRDFSTMLEIEMLKTSILNGYDIISVSSMRATEDIENFTYKIAKNSGYNIGACILSVPVSECFLSAQDRYEEQIKRGECPRNPSLEFLQKTKEGIRNTIIMLQRKPDKPFIRIYNRAYNKEGLPIQIYDSTVSKNYSCALEAFDNPPIRVSKDMAREQLKSIYYSRKIRGAGSEEFISILQIKKLFDIGYEHER